MKTPDQLLSEEDNKLLEVERRHDGLVAFQAELKRVIGDSEFRVQNDLAWDMVWCTLDMLVIDLASWFVGLTDDGGLLGQIKARLGELPIQRPWKDEHEKRRFKDDPGWDDERAEREREAAKSTLDLESNGSSTYP